MPKGTQYPRCTAQLGNGSFCDGQSIPGAPFPICIPHASEMYRFLRNKMDGFESEHADTRLEAIAALIDQKAQARRQRIQAKAPTPTVYYVQVGQLIKIGYSGALATRLASYPPNKRLLATEPGGMDLESSRHRQFAQLLEVGKEWFSPGPELLAHINDLREQAGAASITMAA